MAGSVSYGREFRRVETPTLDGSRTRVDVCPVDGGYEHFSYTSIVAGIAIAEEHGVPRSEWPYYPDLAGAETLVSLDEVQDRSTALRASLENIPAPRLAESAFLSFIRSLLLNNQQFFIT